MLKEDLVRLDTYHLSCNCPFFKPIYPESGDAYEGFLTCNLYNDSAIGFNHQVMQLRLCWVRW